jgi:hypothetical protein
LLFYIICLYFTFSKMKPQLLSLPVIMGVPSVLHLRAYTAPAVRRRGIRL